MFDRAGQLLKMACLLLAALLVYELAQVVLRVNPLSGVVIPELPALAAAKTNAPASLARDTNSMKALAKGTNKPGDVGGTNLVAAQTTNGAQTNVATATVGPLVQTNQTGLTNTEIVQAPTNNIPGVVSSNLAATNVMTNSVVGTNISAPPIVTGTNGSNSVAEVSKSTNGTTVAKGKRGTNGPPGMARGGMPPNGRGVAVADLPPEIKARVNRIYDSEILAQVVRPLPTGLLGIAGNVAFLRTASGQTGLVKEGDTLGDLNCVQIGINRVLVEEGGQKKELTIFDGYGSKNLVPSEKETK